MAKKRNLIGCVFGELTVIAEGTTKLKKGKKYRSTWVCLCSCGKQVTVMGVNLRSASSKYKGTTSCGCKFKKSIKYNSIDLIGKKFGQLTVSQKSDKKTKTRGVIWQCLCDCGEIVEIPTNPLTSGDRVTCNGAMHKNKDQLNPRWKRVGDLPISQVNAMRQNAIKRNLEFEVSAEYLWDLFVQQDKKCALSGIPIIFTQGASSTRSEFTTASLDRIDSSIAYIEGNVRWVHKHLNIMKGSLSDKDFLEYCRQCISSQYAVGKIERPTFDEYFLNIAFDVSLRSDDPNIRHGAVIVTHQNHIIGTGYNATIRGSDKDVIPYHIRDKKRLWMIHAEENAILNCTANPLTIVGGAKLYVTGLPCVNCLQRLINFGIKEIFYADRVGSITENEETQKMRDQLVSMSQIKMNKMSLDGKWLKKNLI